MSTVIASNPAYAPVFTLLKSAFLSSDHGMKPVLIRKSFLQDAIGRRRVPFEQIDTISDDMVDDYLLAYFTKDGEVETISFQTAFEQRIPVATRTGAYFGGGYKGPMISAFDEDAIWANAFRIAVRHNSNKFCYYLRRNNGTLFEAAFERVDMPNELQFWDMRVDQVSERASAICTWANARNSSVYITLGEHPLNACFNQTVTTPEHYAYAVKKIESFGFAINNSNMDVSLIWTQANVLARFSEGPYSSSWKPAIA